jgi:hypothetical protein
VWVARVFFLPQGWWLVVAVTVLPLYAPLSIAVAAAAICCECGDVCCPPGLLLCT